MGSGSPVIALRRSSMSCSDDLEHAGEGRARVRRSVVRNVPAARKVEGLPLEDDPVTDVGGRIGIRFGKLEHPRAVAGEATRDREGRVVRLDLVGGSPTGGG